MPHWAIPIINPCLRHGGSLAYFTFVIETIRKTLIFCKNSINLRKIPFQENETTVVCELEKALFFWKENDYEEGDLHAFRVTYVPGKGMPEKPWWTTHLQYVEVNSTLYERVSSEKEFLEKKDVYYIVPEDAEIGANTILLSDSAFEDKEKFNLRLESDISIQSINWFMAE